MSSMVRSICPARQKNRPQRPKCMGKSPFWTIMLSIVVTLSGIPYRLSGGVMGVCMGQN